MAVAMMTSKGQITIPKSIRDAIGLRVGDKLDFILTEQGEIVLKPARMKAETIFGKLWRPDQRTVTVEEMDEIIRRRIKEDLP